MRSPFALTVLLVCCLPSLAADEKVLHDCEYTRAAEVNPTYPISCRVSLSRSF